MGYCNRFSDLVLGDRRNLRSISATDPNICEGYDEPIPANLLLTSDLATSLSFPGINFHECILPPEDVAQLDEFWK